jgi:anti-sigma factor RsiW
MGNDKEVHLEKSVQAYLDGEMDPGEVKAFEQFVRERPEVARRLRALRRMEDWLGATRPKLSEASAERIGAALDHDLALDADRTEGSGNSQGGPRFLANRSALGGFLEWLRPRWGWATAPILVLGVLLLVYLGPPTQAETKVLRDFYLDAPGAKEVCLVGEFNDWRVCSIPMTLDDKGLWHVVLKVKPGRYEYQFVVDGEWMPDPHAPIQVPSGYGRVNSVAFLWTKTS